MTSPLPNVSTAIAGVLATVAVLCGSVRAEAQTAPASSPNATDEPAADDERAQALAALCNPPAPAPGDPPTAAVFGDGQEHHRPLLTTDLDDACMRLTFPLHARVTGEAVSAFPVDRDGNEYAPGATLTPVLRIGAIYSSGAAWLPALLHVQYEHDLFVATFGSESDLQGVDYPSPVDPDHQLRKAFARLSLAKALHISAGWMTSHWGLGLLANDGDHRYEPGSARFADPRGGDRYLSVQLATGPHSDAGFIAVLGGAILDDDLLADDDVLLEGDTAIQGVAAMLLGEGSAHGGGIYGALRHQEAPDGSATDVVAIDLFLRTAFTAGDLAFEFASESAFITGTTELAPTFDFQEHDVLQFGTAFRGSIDAGVFGTVLDVLYASGDENIDDDQQNAFRADPNYEMGLFLFRQVLAAQTARGAFTAGDPSLVGVPAEDLDRIPTRRSPTNTIAIFPRIRVRPTDGLEFYGGPLFAFAAEDVVDPLNTRVNGGAPHNALGGRSSRTLGMELDIGLRQRLNLSGVQVDLGAEGGVFRPGGAFVTENETRMPAVGGGRLLIEGRL